MKTGIIIQARLGSTRLPGKVLKPFHGDKCILDIILDKLHQASDAQVIVATSTSKDNDALVEHLERNGELVYRGS